MVLLADLHFALVGLSYQQQDLGHLMCLTRQAILSLKLGVFKVDSGFGMVRGCLCSRSVQHRRGSAALCIVFGCEVPEIR